MFQSRSPSPVTNLAVQISLAAQIALGNVSGLSFQNFDVDAFCCKRSHLLVFYMGFGQKFHLGDPAEFDPVSQEIY